MRKINDIERFNFLINFPFSSLSLSHSCQSKVTMINDVDVFFHDFAFLLQLRELAFSSFVVVNERLLLGLLQPKEAAPPFNLLLPFTTAK